MDELTRAVPLRRRLLPVASAWLLAIGLIGATSAIALAGPESGVDVVVHVADTEDAAPGDPPTACTFHLHFQAAEALTGYFDIRAGDEDGAVVADGEFDTTTGDSATGVFELDPGAYLITWDDEAEVDRSFDEQAIVVACEAPSPTGSELPIGSEAPSPSGSELPIGSEGPAPSGSELPVSGGAPTGGVAGVAMTPPATDTGAPASKAGSSAALPIAIMLGLTALLATWAVGHRPAPAAQKVRSRDR